MVQNVMYVRIDEDVNAPSKRTRFQEPEKYFAGFNPHLTEIVREMNRHTAP